MTERYGRFYVRREWIDDGLDKYIFDGTVVPVRFEHLYYNDTFEVVAISDRFTELQRGQAIPFYHVDVKCDHVEDRDITGLLIGGHCENWRVSFERDDDFVPLQKRGCD